MYVCMSVFIVCACVCVYVCMFVCMSVCLYVCVYVCMYVYIYTYLYAFVCIHVWLYACTYMYLYIYTYIHEWMNEWTNEWRSKWINEWLNARMHVCMYKCMHGCMHACIYVYTVQVDSWMDETQPTEPQTISVHISNIDIGGCYLFLYVYLYMYMYICLYVYTAYIHSSTIYNNPWMIFVGATSSWSPSEMRDNCGPWMWDAKAMEQTGRRFTKANVEHPNGHHFLTYTSWRFTKPNVVPWGSRVPLGSSCCSWSTQSVCGGSSYSFVLPVTGLYIQ